MGHEGFLTEGDWLLLGNAEEERMVRGMEGDWMVLQLGEVVLLHLLIRLARPPFTW